MTKVLSLAVAMFAIAGMTGAFSNQAYAGPPPPSGDVTKLLLGTDECFMGITIVKTGTTPCQFILMYNGDPAIVEDTVPAEFENACDFAPQHGMRLATPEGQLP